MHQEGVGDPAEPRPRLVVVDGDRLVGEVAAGQHERAVGPVREQVVQGRVREQDTEPRRARRDRLGDRGPVTAVQEHDRPRRRSKQRPLLLGDLAERLRRGRHQRERLRLAALARAKRRDRGLVARIAREVKAAQALDRDDRLPRGAWTRSSTGIDRRGPHTGQALGSAWKRRSAGSRTRAGTSAHIVKPAMVVDRPVVGHRPHDGEAGTAMGAVGERVAIAAVGRVEELTQAIGTGGQVGRDRGRAAATGSPGCEAASSRGSTRRTSRLGRAAAPRSGRAASKVPQRRPRRRRSPPRRCSQSRRARACPRGRRRTGGTRLPGRRPEPGTGAARAAGSSRPNRCSYRCRLTVPLRESARSGTPA